jgi:ribonuclease VapC
MIIHDAERCRISAANFVELSMVGEGQIGPEAGRQCDVFFRRAEIVIEPVTVEQDCFAYALAKATAEPLLFKGDHFSKTDVRAALTAGS